MPTLVAQARALPSSPLRRKVSKALQRINPKFGKYSTTVYNVLASSGGGLPKPGATYGAQWQYDTLREKLVAEGLDIKDAEEIIKGLWTSMLPSYTNLTPALLKQLDLAGVTVTHLSAHPTA